MNGCQTDFGGLLRRGMSSCIALLVLSISHAVHAAPFDWLPGSQDTMQSLVIRPPVAHDSVLAFDAGNMTLHNGRSAIIVAYEPDSSPETQKELRGLAPPLKDRSGLGGVSLTLAFTF